MHKIEKVTLPTVKHIIAIASGKGGVGKSTVATNLALAFAHSGIKTALVDADLFGPSIPTLFEVEGQRCIVDQTSEKVLLPIEKFGIKLMSIGFLVDAEQPLIWRGPMASSTLLQLFNETLWGDIDIMVVDLPPGTGDIPLTLCQQIDVNGIIIVTTPQILALSDVQKAISMFNNKDLKIPVWGIIENMAWFTPSEHPDEKYYLFGKDGGKTLAAKFNTELLAQIPLVQMIEHTKEGSINHYTQNKIITDSYKQLLNKIKTHLTKLSNITINKEDKL